MATEQGAFGEQFADAIKNVLTKYVEEAMEVQIEQACERLRTTLRREVAKIVMSTHDMYTVESFGRELRITVQVPKVLQ